MLFPIILVFMTAWGYLFYKYRDVFAPWSVTLLIWSLIMFLYEVVDHGLYSVKPQFVYAIVLWCASLCTASYLSFRLVPAYKGQEWAPNEKIVKFFAIIGLFLMPYLAYKTVSFALANGSVDELVTNLRAQTTGEGDSTFKFGPEIYYQYVACVLLFTAANAKEKINKKLLLLAFCMCLCYAIFTMSKIILFIAIVPLLYLLYENKKISLRPIIIFGVAFLFLGLLFTAFRSNAEDSDVTMMDLFGMYVVSPIVAFSYESPNVSYFWGEETFQYFYRLLEKLGMTTFQGREALQEFTFLPIPTNVYTVMAPYFRDFGYAGLGVMGVLQGLLFGYIYKKGETGFTLAKLFYAYIVVLLVLQFFDEIFFSSFSNAVLIVILICLFHIKVVWKPLGKS